MNLIDSIVNCVAPASYREEMLLELIDYKEKIQSNPNMMMRSMSLFLKQLDVLLATFKMRMNSCMYCINAKGNKNEDYGDEIFSPYYSVLLCTELALEAGDKAVLLVESYLMELLKLPIVGVPSEIIKSMRRLLKRCVREIIYIGLCYLIYYLCGNEKMIPLLKFLKVNLEKIKINPFWMDYLIFLSSELKFLESRGELSESLAQSLSNSMNVLLDWKQYHSKEAERMARRLTDQWFGVAAHRTYRAKIL